MLATASEMKNGFGKYLKHVVEESGEVVITKNNVRVARLVPYVSDLEKYFSVHEHAAVYDYNKKTVSYEEFMEIYEKSDVRMEYINGEIYVLGSPSYSHQAILGNLHITFREFFTEKKCKVLMAPFDVHFNKQDIDVPDVMQPDLLVLCDLENNINEKDRYRGIPTLTLEILSSSTRSVDMVLKLNTFMASGVSEYWIVDPKNQRITIYTFVEFQVDQVEHYKPGEIVKSVTFDGLAAEVSTIFDI